MCMPVQIDDDMVVKNVKKQRTKLFGTTPIAYQMLAGLDIQPTQDPAVCDTFATDGEIIIVNTVFANALVDLDVRGILLHESLHIELYHHTRLARWLPKIRALYPEWTDENFMELWNIGADYAINGALKRSDNYGRDFTLPDETLLHDIYSGAGWSVEKIVGDMVRKGWKPTPKPPPPPPGRKPPPPGGKPPPPGGTPPPPGGTQPPPPGPKKPVPGKGRRIGDVRLPPKCDPETPGGDKAIEEEERRVGERAAEARMIEKSMGKGKGNLADVIKGSQGKTVSPEYIRHFLRKNFSHKRSLKRPNRRFLHRKLYIPAKIKTPHTLYVCIDSSASMGRDEFEAARKNIVMWSKNLGLSKIRVSYVDRCIHMNPDKDEPWFDIDLNSGAGADNMQLDIWGGGGTSFDPIFNYLEENNPDNIGGLVYFTDGCGRVGHHTPTFPVLWVSTYCEPSFQAEPFGEVMYI